MIAAAATAAALFFATLARIVWQACTSPLDRDFIRKL